MASKVFTMKAGSLEKVLKNIENYDKKVALGIDHELSEAAENVAALAKIHAPNPKIAATIQAVTTKPYSKSVEVNHKRAAYEEFGTGRYVFQSAYKFTSEQKAFAKLFYVNGLGTTPANPYLFPAFDVEIPKLLSRIKKVLFDDL